MVSRALLMKVYEKQGAASSEEEAFLRVLTHVNYKNTVVYCNGVQIICARGESVISYLGWADILGWTASHTRRFFFRCFAEGVIERIAGDCPSHIRIPNYDAWTGHPDRIKKTEVSEKEIANATLEESLQQFIDRYSEVTHLPPESKDRLRGLWKKLSTRERECAQERIEDYYYSLSNTNYCYQAAKYLEYKIFNNNFTC